ncbi:hypothetical protein [Comamonas thiooxydans]|uniref:hypothetical protein n=1 Tax=Comamonas thiooxydans TaxID=363952 RepID=UPI00209BFA70|nr:hypothetical protein [Comamonas thiooxydans]MCO8249844.1 hypothetical protein [Comamonas thiooxydans]
MQTTMELLDAALQKKNSTEWAAQLKLSGNALRTAKHRGNLSPAIAGALAEELGEDPQKWIVIAALESERESACKTRMVRKFLTGAAIAGTLMGASGAATAAVASAGESVYYVKYLGHQVQG